MSRHTRLLLLLLLVSLFDLACSNAIVPCEVRGAEECNGIDDDCDGLTDEDFAVGKSCDGPDSDQCANGTTVCSADGRGTECGPEEPANIVEICNNADDDCDGETDEGLTRCACTNGGSPGTERCNDIDDDCDGTVDESLTLCGCRDGAPPVAELCNGIDDDCNDIIDDGFAVGMACDGPDGDQCANGTIVCSADGRGTECGPEEPADIVESCNNADDDCDGEIDNGLGNCACSGGGSPGPESCNNVDDDCNGAVDDGLSNCACSGGGSPGPESCNNVDDDCNGAVDDGLGNCACSDGGSPGPESCNNIDDDCNEAVDDGLSNCQCTGGQNPQQEFCDGIDNDCDGQVDEDNGSGGGCAGFGEPCTSWVDCSSQICAGDDFDRYCTTECDPASDPAGWPAGYRCLVGSNRDYYARNYPPCGSDADCAPDGVCTVQEADDQMSLQHQCRPPLAGGGTPGASCDGGNRCANDMCSWFTGLCSEACDDVADCTGSYLGAPTSCVLSWEVVYPGDCGRDAQCPVNYSCVNAHCRGPACSDDGECLAGYSCQAINSNDPPDKACLPAPFFDYLGECRIACAGDPDCPSGLQCHPAVLVDSSAVQGFCRNPPSGQTTPTGAGPCGGAGDPPCSHGICYSSGSGTYCTQLCGDAGDCPGVMNCTPGSLNMGDLGSFPGTLTCTN